MRLFHTLFKRIPSINIPKCYYFDEKHIIMSHEEGINLFNFLDLYKNNQDIIEQTYTILFYAIYEMCQKKIIHGDFHAGNLLFFIKDDKVNMSIVDYGIILKITDEQKKFFLKSFDNIEEYYKMDRIKQFANFFWYFGEHTKEYSRDEFIKRTLNMNNNKNNNIILPPKKIMYIPKGGINVLINKELLEMGFKIKIENYNMLITLEILMNKIINLANINKNFKNKLKKYILKKIDEEI